MVPMPRLHRELVGKTELAVALPMNAMRLANDLRYAVCRSSQSRGDSVGAS